MNRFSWDLRYPNARDFPGLILWSGSTRGPIAPVTLGRLPGRPDRVWRAIQAKPIASTKSGSTPSSQ